MPKNPFAIFKKTNVRSEALRENEFQANHTLTFGCLFCSGVILILWILYLTGVFYVNSPLLINIFFPICIALLASPMIYIKSPRMKKPSFKYFLLSLFILVMAILNSIIPKHAILGWAIVIILAAHYYSPRVSLVTYIIIVVLMLVCVYVGMFIGEWDSNILGVSQPADRALADDPAYRYQILHDQLYGLGEFAGKAVNRYARAGGYYYVARFAALTIMFFISLQLSIRTEKMMTDDAKLVEEREKISSELNIASKIQTSMLPRDFPNTNEFELYGLMDPAKEVGGDFYDFYLNKTNELVFTIGDVSGKGVPAALAMMGTKTLLKSSTKSSQRLEKVFEQANQELCQFNGGGMFVTAVTARFNLDSGEVTFCNAGHNPIIVKRNNKFEYIKLPIGFVLGGFETSMYKTKTINLLPNDQIFFYTDGVTEATNENGELFGEERLLNVLNAHLDLNPEALTKMVKEEIDKFVGSANQFDDITILSVLYKGNKAIKKEITVESLAENVEVVTEFVNNYLDRYSDNIRAKTQINVAIDELFSNIVKFAYSPEVGEAIIRIELREDPVSISISFIDHGKPFNPLELDNPDLDLSLDERKAGGLGIFIVRQSMDEISYEYKDGQNILTIRKKL